jgi:hypothetical protein
MADALDMSVPVTRDELQQDLKRLEQATSAKIQQATEPLATKTELERAIESLATKAELERAIEPLATKAELQQVKAELEKAIGQLATKVELEMWGGALLERIDSDWRRTQAQLTSLEHRLFERIERMQQQLQTDLSRHANAIHESVAALIHGFDDKYKDLPPRVTRLESAVFSPKPP